MSVGATMRPMVTLTVLGTSVASSTTAHTPHATMATNMRPAPASVAQASRNTGTNASG